MTLLLLFAFAAGFITILAPCIWPLLPIVLSASAGEGKRRPFGITLGVMLSFTIFTLSISYLEKFLNLDPNVFRLLAVIVIGLLGLAMVIPALGTAFENFIQRVLSPLQRKATQQGQGFGAGFATGCAIGLVWAPCAGPILATVATLAATQAVDARVVLVTLAYVSGLGIPLFFFALAGARFFSKMRQINKFTGIVQQCFGVVMIIAAILIYTNYDKVIQIKILESFPAYGNFLNKFEHNDVVTEELSRLRKDQAEALTTAPEFKDIVQWLNGEPLRMNDLRGKVVLVDFWTYSCINCVRTLPHVTSWYEKYKNDNLVVVGVHTPEFAFEKDAGNVQHALKQFNIKYPVALDNDYGTWKAYQNRFWPAKYLIDANGRIRYTHFGEGAYAETEDKIRALLKEAGQAVSDSGPSLADETPQHVRTPETYLGSARMERFSSNEAVDWEPQVFTHSSKIPKDHFVFEGRWHVEKESAKALENAALEFRFNASQVFLVISPNTPGDTIQVLLDGRTVLLHEAGADVQQGILTLDQERLYHLIDLKGKVEERTLRLEFLKPGIKVYAFTFG